MEKTDPSNIPCAARTSLDRINGLPAEERRAAAKDPHEVLRGDWRVERSGGLLPPMFGVWKRVRGAGGETCVGPLPVWPFRLEAREGYVALIYERPFSSFVDELRPGSDRRSWLGRATFRGRELGHFDMTKLASRPRPRSRRA